MTPTIEPVKLKTEYKKSIFTCEKCKHKIGIESDHLSDSAMKSMHKCKGGSSGKSK